MGGGETPINVNSELPSPKLNEKVLVAGGQVALPRLGLPEEIVEEQKDALQALAEEGK